MNIEKIKEFINIRKDLKESGVIGLDLWENKVHLSMNELINLPGLNVVHCGSEKYPYEAFAIVDGIEFFAVFNSRDLEKYPQLKELIPMVEDVDLSGMPEVNESA